MSFPYSLKPFNTFGVDQSCLSMIEVHSKAELQSTCLSLYQSKRPMLVLGGGSNIVFTDDFNGTVVRVLTKGISCSEDDTHFYLAVEAGENWHELVQFSLNQNMPGLENLALIPGTVGAAPIQNIGAYGVELCDICDWVEYMDLESGNLLRLTVDECEFAYRESIFKGSLRDKAVISAVGLRLPKAWQPKLAYGPLQSFNAETVTPREIFDRVCEVRSEKLPNPEELGNAGSFFKNPIVSAATYMQLAARFPSIVGYAQPNGEVKLAAGWLIEHAGLKGFALGNAGVHAKQALVLVNLGHATGQDICRLALHVIARVNEVFGVKLEAEPRIMGLTGETSLDV
ncbi:UDP-N-acetylmuramate dehydrogenase [Shewanella bicestrii]|uniref:UDP-N-acetylmuramate dehydrogenase n=1 Tax=Shewanella sp. GD03713 TaxID=2975372 RepID=UPI002449650C|nr:UDP-N-acetylmuramate dehydrogenase [Shewanella sp. GD03713]MDH1468548.1 UDP-N-acetylmuramate dehydrogenase [Shewanella sp. GD03713]